MLDQEMLYTRFLSMINFMLDSKEGELVEHLKNIDYCIRRDDLNRIISDAGLSTPQYKS